MAKMLIIDNYDSFTYNLVQMFMNYNINLDIYRNDEIKIVDIENNLPDYVLIGPGPKKPTHAGISKKIIETFYSRIPILGICLGMQCINEIFGGKTIKSNLPVHGKTSDIYHEGNGLFKGVPSPFRATRYHSLIIKQHHDATNINPLIVNARTYDGIIMGFSHINFPVHGLQFHPESFLTDYGFLLIENFLEQGPIKIKL